MRSCAFKMLNSEVAFDRIIYKFPEPYNIEYTPYEKTDFSELTYKTCNSQKHLISNVLKICKVIIIGDVAVGKTCIVNRFCQKIFDSNYKTTIGVDFEVEKFQILDTPFNLQIWDTAGQERFKCIAQSYYRGAHAIIVTFDLTDMHSMTNCTTWLKEALNPYSAQVKPYIFLVGSKRDLLKMYAYKHVEQSAVKLARRLNAEFWPISSKTGFHITDLFLRIAALTFDDCVTKEMERFEINKPMIESDLISFKKNNESKKNIENKCDGMRCQTN